MQVRFNISSLLALSFGLSLFTAAACAVLKLWTACAAMVVLCRFAYIVFIVREIYSERGHEQ